MSADIPCIVDVAATSSGGVVLYCPVNTLPLRRLMGGMASPIPGGGSVIRLPVNGMLGRVGLEGNGDMSSGYIQGRGVPIAWSQGHAGTDTGPGYLRADNQHCLAGNESID